MFSQNFNPHPPLASLPAAFFVAAAVIEICARFFPSLRERLRGAVTVLVVLGTLGVIAAFFSGYRGSSLANQSFVVPDDPISLHHICGRLVMLFSFPLVFAALLRERALARPALVMWAFRILLLLVAGGSLYVSWLGGELVFRYGAGVRLAPGTQSGSETPAS